jgi:uncharacterized protein DUF6334
MLDVLAKIHDEGGRLTGVSCIQFGGDTRFTTAIGLRFERLSAILRANPDDDSLVVSLGALTAGSDEMLADISNAAPWSVCLGAGACWLWELTNQQGYKDGMRLEFGNPNEHSRGVVELLVVASAIQVFAAHRAA